MYKNRGPDGRCNLCGQRVAQLRKSMKPKVSQRAECGKRFVTDVELKILAQVLGVTADELLQ